MSTEADPNSTVHREEAQGLRNAAGFINRLAISFLLVVTYLSIVVATTRHEILVLPDSRLPLPILNVQVSVVGFFFFAPLIILVLHVYVLLERLRLTRRLRLSFPAGAGNMDHPELPFLPAFLSLGLAARPLDSRLRALLGLAFMLLAFLPLGALLAVQWAYRPAHSVLTWLHQVCILADVVALWYLVLAAYCERCGKAWRPGLRRRVILLLVVTLPCLTMSLWLLSLPPLATTKPYGLNHHLDLQRWQPPPTASERGRLSFGIDDLRFANLAEAQLRGADLRELDLRRASLAGADLRMADLRGTRLDGADLSAADLRGANLGSARLERAQLTDARLEGASLVGARLQGASAHRTSFFAADLSNSRLTAADLRQADLRLTRLTDAWLRGTRLIDAQLEAAELPRQALGADLRAASLPLASGLELVGVDLRLAKLRGASLCNTNNNFVDLRAASRHYPDLLANERRFLQAELEPLITEVAEWSEAQATSAQHRLDTALDRGACVPEPGDPTVADVFAEETIAGMDVAEVGAKLAQTLVDLTCDDPYLTELLIARASGELLPTAPFIEGRLAQLLLEESGAPECTELWRHRRRIAATLRR